MDAPSITKRPVPCARYSETLRVSQTKGCSRFSIEWLRRSTPAVGSGSRTLILQTGFSGLTPGVYARNDSRRDSRVANQCCDCIFSPTRLATGYDHSSVTLDQSDSSQQFASVQDWVCGGHGIASSEDPGLTQVFHHAMRKQTLLAPEEYYVAFNNVLAVHGFDDESISRAHSGHHAPTCYLQTQGSAGAQNVTGQRTLESVRSIGM